MTASKFPWVVTAQQEYEKDPLLRPEDIKNLQSWMKTQPHLPEVDEEMIQHLLHACYYDMERTKSTIEALYTYKNTMPDFFCKWDTNDPEIQDVMNNVLIVAPLPQYDSDGNRVMICKLNDNDPAKYNYSVCIKWLMMSSFHTLWSSGIQKGYVLVYDATGFTMSHLFKCPLSSAKNYISFGENASPIRVLKVVFINTSPVVKKLISLVKPFLNKELMNMMTFHSSYEQYFQGMPAQNVPADYGGSAPPLLSLHREYVQKLLTHKDWLLEEEKVRCDESKRLQKNENSLSVGSFKKMEVD